MPSRKPIADPEQLEEPKSKSQLKREMTALQQLGEKLVNLPAKTLAKAPLSEDLRDEVEQVIRITHHEGRRRQLQYLGKIMRRIDCEEIKQFLHDIERGNHRDKLPKLTFNISGNYYARLKKNPNEMYLRQPVENYLNICGNRDRNKYLLIIPDMRGRNG
jgi:hypothetical protein